MEPRQTRRDTRAETTPPHHEEKDSGGYAEQQDDNSPTGLKHLNDVVLGSWAALRVHERNYPSPPHWATARTARLYSYGPRSARIVMSEYSEPGARTVRFSRVITQVAPRATLLRARWLTALRDEEFMSEGGSRVGSWAQLMPVIRRLRR